MQIIRVKGISAMGRTKGCELGPLKILESLGEIYSNEKGKIIDKKLFSLEEIHVDNNNVEEANELIYENSREIFSEQDKALFIGGDHSVSYGLVRGFRENFESPFLIVFDAHVDCMTPGKEPTHEEWLRKLIEEGFPAGNVIIVAARNLHQEEREFIDKNKIQVFGMKELQENRQEICDILMERARNSEAFYISIDIDSVDPAFAPGTGYLEPGGLSSRELIYFLQRLALLKNFRGADIVEINPDKDDGKTVKLGAKILAELI
ncbi:hypothetical protein A3K73_06505 [Candidatus Pacearchaeota archaeon RBG_13_36_9]|nr:MAG: hypothetical protein A3K73_06505 [Candidatus Pacearchaeota archaeon RBG_13_36_9]